MVKYLVSLHQVLGESLEVQKPSESSLQLQVATRLLLD